MASNSRLPPAEPDDVQIGHTRKLFDDRPLLAVLRYGSRLHGTDHEDSDIDLRVILVPRCDEILLGSVDFAVQGNCPDTRMTPNSLDIQGFSLMRFLRLLGKGDMTALELLGARRTAGAVLHANPFFDIIMAESPDMTGAPRQNPLDRARKTLGPLAPDAASNTMAAHDNHPSPGDVAHAIRLLLQWEEFHETGQITFPRPEHDTLRRIRTGLMPAEEIQQLLHVIFTRLKGIEDRLRERFPQPNPTVAEMRTLQIHRAVIDNII